jgi:GT2 family glycosyltransferase
MTCHNRRDKTLACLEALHRNHLPENVSLSVVLVDDGSSDGTANAVRDRFPGLQVIRADGSLFWNGGMRRAYEAAQARAYDHLLWLNDDTILNDDAVERLLATESRLHNRSGRPAIIVGSTRMPGGDRPSYGGTIRPDRFRPMRFVLVAPGSEPIECDTMNGNVVLVPREIALALGNLEPRFVHAIGDTDYGLRSKAAGYSIWVMPGFAGTCVNDNAIAGSFNDLALPLAVRMRKILSPKGLPPRAWLVLTRRHAGVLWPLHWAWPYIKVVMTSVACFIRHAGKRQGDRA